MDTIDLIVTLCFLHCRQRNPHLKSKRWQKQVGFFFTVSCKTTTICLLLKRGKNTVRRARIATSKWVGCKLHKPAW